jgi:hypothetical protein
VRLGEAQRVESLDAVPLGIGGDRVHEFRHLPLGEALGEEAGLQGRKQPGREHDFPCGRNVDAGNAARRRLVEGVEPSEVADPVEIEGDTDRTVVAGHEHVDDLAADRELAPDADVRHPQVPHLGEAPGCGLGVECLAALNCQALFTEPGGIGDGGQERAQRRDHQQGLTSEKTGEYVHPVAEQGGRGARALVRRGAPPGEERHARVREALEVLLDVLSLTLRGGDHE